MEKISSENINIPRKPEKSGYKWTVGPGGRLFIEDQKYGDKSDWYPVIVDKEHIVTIEKGRIRRLKSGGTAGFGKISKIDGGSFNYADTLVQSGKKAKIYFPLKE